MTLPIPAATARIASQLGAVERKADDMLISLNELMVSMLRARANREVAVHTGQRALIRLMAAQQSILESSNNIFRCHDEMSTIAREMAILDEDGLTPKSPLVPAEQLRKAS